jgi:hypothetical protein
MKAFSTAMRDTPFAITTMNFNEIHEFQKDCKRLQKKYLSLKSDISEFQSVVSAVPLGNSKHFNVITQEDSIYIVKARLFCRYLKGSSMRIIYAFHAEEEKIEFIELYFKGDKENEDRGRIEEYLRKLQT